MRQRFKFTYFLSEGYHSIFTHGLMSFAAVCMIVACLVIMGSFSLVALNVSGMLGDLERDNEFFAFVEESYDESQVRELQAKLERIPNVREVKFTSKAEAKQAFADRYKDTEDAPIFQDLPDEVYRDRFGIKVEDIEQFGATASAVEAVEGVAWVREESEVANGFVVVRNVAAGVAVILAAILVVVSLFIISNTIKLGTFTRRDEIAIMKMCGATNAFVRWPFVVEGMLLGLAGAVVAFFLQWGIYVLIGKAITTSDTIRLITIIPFSQVRLMVAGAFAATGIIVGVGGSVMAIRKFLQV